MAKDKMMAPAGARVVRRETFDGLPIVDADADFSLIVRTRDLKAAKGNEKDAANCILAKACANQVGATTVAFFRSVAYLDLPDDNGNRRVVRYLLDESAAAIVSAFDKGETVKGEVMVTLKAPSESMTLDAIRERSRSRNERKRKSVVNGEIIEPVVSQRRLHKSPSVKDMDVRSGTGLVQSVIRKAKKT